MVNAPLLNLTHSVSRLVIFVIIFIVLSLSNHLNAQDNYIKNFNTEFELNRISSENKFNNKERPYVDFTEDKITINDNLDVNVKSYKRIHGKFMPITGNVKELYKFFRALKVSNKKNIRIAHYGDSILLGDVITENLRQNLQEKFGGDGVGFLSIKPVDIRMKKTINQTVSGNWIVGSIAKGNPKHFPMGLSGFTAKATINSRVKFQTTKFMKSSRSFNVVRIFYSNANSSSKIKYSLEGGKYISKKLKSGIGIKELVLHFAHLENVIDINFGEAAGTYFYGVSLEKGKGVYIDNFPLNGNSGVSLTKIKENTLTDFDKYLNYKLIILQFGVNATQLTMNFNWYKNKMVRVINHLKKAFPNASILVVSVGDKSIKRGSRFVTDPIVEKLLKTQKKIIASTNVAFWNLYDAMGGKNSLNKWVNAGPPLGLRDYIHFTNLGGKVVADLITQALLKEYNKMR